VGISFLALTKRKKRISFRPFVIGEGGGGGKIWARGRKRNDNACRIVRFETKKSMENHFPERERKGGQIAG